VPMSSAPAERV